VDRKGYTQRLAATLIAIFGAMALFLAGIGLYAVMSYSVSQSTRELGLRMALGADMKDLLGMVMSHGLRLTAAGIVIGAVAAGMLTRLMGNLLYKVNPRDPIAFGLALLLNAEIRARKFFRVVFLLPLMLSPVAVSWMIGKSLMEYRFGPAAMLARYLGWDDPAFFASPWIARLSIEAMDAWVSIPFIMIMLLAGLQAMPKDVLEATKVDGASAWQSFWHVTFPLMLPVSVTVLIIRIIFKLKLADIVINVTAGGPCGATDTFSSFIYRVYRDRSNVGYGTGLAMFYLLMIIVFLTVLLRLSSRWTQKVA